MFENIRNIFKRNRKKELLKSSSKNTAKERLHLVLMQDRANVSADFLDLMRKEIIEVIKKYIEIDEKAIDVRLTTETTESGEQGAPALYANIPIINIKEEARKMGNIDSKEENKDKNMHEEAKNVDEKQEDIKNEKNEEIKKADEKQEEIKNETKKNEEINKVDEQQEDIKNEKNVEEKQEDVKNEQKNESNEEKNPENIDKTEEEQNKTEEQENNPNNISTENTTKEEIQN